MKYILALIFFSAFYCNASAQDLKAGYMQINWLSGYTYSGTTYLLTDENTDENRPFIMVDWGVKIDTFKLIQTTIVGTGILKKYVGNCTYPGPGYYHIIYTDTFRIVAIKNIYPSANERLRLESNLNITTFLGPDTAPELGNKEIRLITQSNKVVFQPIFQDAEGDSLSFQLTPCYSINYHTPINVSIDRYGNVFFSRDSLGIYAFSLIITEWRKDSDLSYHNIGSSQIDFVMDITFDVGINEIQLSDNIKIYPNPTSSTLYISDEQNELQNSTIEITNSIGQTIISVPFNNSLDVSNLSPGCYFLNITTDKKQVLHSKFIKE